MRPDSYSAALQALEDGYKVANKRWNGKNMFLFLVKPYDDLIQGFTTYHISGISPEKCLPFICMRTADGAYVPWLASQSDMLLDGWYVVND